MFKLKRESLGRSTSIFLGLTIGIDLSDSIVNTSELQYPVGERRFMIESKEKNLDILFWDGSKANQYVDVFIQLCFIWRNVIESKLILISVNNIKVC